MLRSALGVGVAIAWISLGGCGGSASDPKATAEPISCNWREFGAGNWNEKRIGSGCHASNPTTEALACPGQFCTRRVLADRWPALAEDQVGSGHCTTHCETTSDCGTGYTCCEPRLGAFCLPYEEDSIFESGCSEECATNHLGCGEGEICCARLGSICIADHCSGVCPR